MQTVQTPPESTPTTRWAYEELVRQADMIRQLEEALNEMKRKLDKSPS